jgi:hypothetical protein
MIYTFGHVLSYEEHIAAKSANGEIAYKIGFRERYEYPDGKIEPYLGGAVWRTPEEGFEYIDTLDFPEEWSVYALEGSFDDVYYIEGEPFHRLRIDCPIIGRVDR